MHRGNKRTFCLFNCTAHHHGDKCQRSMLLIAPCNRNKEKKCVYALREHGTFTTTKNGKGWPILPGQGKQEETCKEVTTIFRTAVLPKLHLTKIFPKAQGNLKHEFHTLRYRQCSVVTVSNHMPQLLILTWFECTLPKHCFKIRFAIILITWLC